VCDRFEDAWLAGQRPRLEDYLEEATPAERSTLLDELLRVELAYHVRHGECPTAARYRLRFPDHSERIDALFATLVPQPSTESQSPASAKELPQVPGYEILGELGRGGMGVVYKARQVKANRVVALKMILAGGYAGEADLTRFRTEAEAIARLQHPNIVQIYEVGEHDGKPFFSLEFCACGSLDRQLDGTPLQPQEAARLVETLARAMQAAHEKNVIHRDLKPANILLVGGEGQSPGSGEPGGARPPLADLLLKIADFGLAKKVDQTGQTATGAILGTPSYMAPEQAGGKSKEVGAAADIYALGAILYELLTGRPPFKAATPLDTMLQVLSEEPVPPSRLQRRLPRDLDTICLKCLQKQPSRRYSAACELADDLRRFLGGEPIRARPVGAVERVWKWAQRRPALAALLATLTLFLAVLMAAASAVLIRDGIRRQALATAIEQALNEAEKGYKDFGEIIKDVEKAYKDFVEKTKGLDLKILFDDWQTQLH
jgi:serine/threonine protein kinase